MATRMQQRRGTAAQWTAANPILNVGEIGYETDTNKFKIGDGTNHWANLIHFYDSATVGALIDQYLDFEDAPETLDTIKELAAALNNDPNFLANIVSNESLANTLGDYVTDGQLTNAIANLATFDYVDGAVAAITVDISATAGSGLTYNAMTDQLDVDLNSIQARVANVSDAEIAYLDGVTSNIQSQIDGKQDIVANVSSTEIATLDGITSNIQEQLDSKVSATDLPELSVDAVANALTSATHTNITVTYDDNAGTISIEAAPGYNDENAQDAVGLNVGAGLTYDDNNGAISVDTATIQARVANVSDTEIGYLDGVTSGIQSQIDGKLSLSGGTMTGAITLAADPTQAMHATTKQYVDTAAEGLLAKPSVDVATTANLTATYNNGTSGVGATLTIAATATLNIDGKTSWSQYDSVLIKNQTNAFENGRYVLTTVGDAGTAWVFTRCGLCDEADEIPGAYMFVVDGTTNGQTSWVLHVDNPATFTVGTDDIDAFQFSGAGTYTAGTGLSLNGNQIEFSNSGVATFAATPSSANLAAAVSDETGSGALVFGTSPTLVTPRVQLAMNAQTGTTYTLALNDASNRWVTMDNSSAITVTVPPSVFSVGDQISVQQTGAGQVTFAQGSGVTITSAGVTTAAPKIRTRYASAVVICTGSNTFTVIGDII